VCVCLNFVERGFKVTADEVEERMRLAFAMRDMYKYNRLKMLKKMLELQQIFKEMKQK
jgi:hypothetical protein